MRQSTIDILIGIGFEVWRSRQRAHRDTQQALHLAAKRNNHRVALLATTVNTVALAILGAAFITPRIGGSLKGPYAVWIVVAIGLHFVAQSLYGFLRAGD